MRIISPLDFGAIAKGRRIDLGLSQTQLAEQAGVSRKWISEFERGKPTAEVALILAVFEAMKLNLHATTDTTRGASNRATTDRDKAQLRVLLNDLGLG